MAASYVTVSFVIVFGLLSLFSAIAMYTLTRTPVLAHLVLAFADRTALTLTQQAAGWEQGGEINPAVTFEPGQPASLRAEGGQAEVDELTFYTIDVPYIAPGTADPQWPAVALLIGPEGQVIASSYPDQYPAAQDYARVIPGDIALVRNALAGKPDYRVSENERGRVVSVAQPVWSQDRTLLGAVYVQTPAGGAADVPLLAQVAGVAIPGGMVLLCFMLPIGAFFGVLTTRGLVRRIERLARATARFTEGDFSQQVPVSQADEIGQLEQQFNRMAEQLVDSIAQRQALAAQSARREERARIEQEMSSAYYIQKSLLPKDTPAIPGLEITTFYKPAQQVGGDLYDFLALPDGRLGLVIGDATGKGMPSALIMATTCAMLRAAAPVADSPGQALAQVNDLLHIHIPAATFATCFYALLDTGNGRIRFANAGHNLPYRAHAGKVSELRAAGMPLGLMPEQDYPEQEVSLVKGDYLVFYSDGLVEAHNENGEMFGSPRLMELVQANSDGAGLIEILLKELEEFTGNGWQQEDDITLVVLRKV